MQCAGTTEIPPAGAPPCGCVPGRRGALRATFKQRRSRLLAPRLGDGVRLCGNVLLHRSPSHPVCRYDEVIYSEMTRG